MRNKKNRLGYTLVEVLVTMVIFSMVMMMVVAIYIKGLRYHRALSSAESDFRNAEMTFARITRELTCDAESVEYPLPENEGNSIVFRSFATDNNPSGIIGYIFYPEEHQIKRVIYSEFNVDDASACIAASDPQIMAYGVKYINYSFKGIGNNLMHIFMTTQGADREYVFETFVKIR